MLTAPRPSCLTWRSGHAVNLTTFDWLQDWCTTIREHVAAGRTRQRATIVSEPLSDYQRWSQASSRPMVEAGEDIRWVPRRSGVVLVCMPGNDYYLLDDERVVFLHYAGSGLNTAFTTTTDPADVEMCR